MPAVKFWAELPSKLGMADASWVPFRGGFTTWRRKGPNERMFSVIIGRMSAVGSFAAGFRLIQGFILDAGQGYPVGRCLSQTK